jgi:hypothetical protein
VSSDTTLGIEAGPRHVAAVSRQGVDQLRALNEPVGVGAAAVQLHVPEFVDARQIDPSVARDGLRQRLLVGGSTSSLASLVASVYSTRKPDIAASVPSDQEMDLPVPESPIKHSGWPFLTHSYLARMWTTAGSTLGLALKPKPRRTSRGELGSRDPALGSTACSVVTLGQQQFCEESSVGHLLVVCYSCCLPRVGNMLTPFDAERAGHCILGSCVGSAYMGGQP